MPLVENRNGVKVGLIRTFGSSFRVRQTINRTAEE